MCRRCQRLKSVRKWHKVWLRSCLHTQWFYNLLEKIITCLWFSLRLLLVSAGSTGRFLYECIQLMASEKRNEQGLIRLNKWKHLRGRSLREVPEDTQATANPESSRLIVLSDLVLHWLKCVINKTNSHTQILQDHNSLQFHSRPPKASFKLTPQ